MNWISVKERLPEVDIPVLVYAGNDMYVTAFQQWDYDEATDDLTRPHWYCVGDYDDISALITHWLPLPPPPEIEFDKPGQPWEFK